MHYCANATRCRFSRLLATKIKSILGEIAKKEKLTKI